MGLPRANARRTQVLSREGKRKRSKGRGILYKAAWKVPPRERPERRGELLGSVIL